MADDGGWDRRSLLRGAAVVAGAAVTVPLLGRVATAQAGPGGDADRRRGHMALLANTSPDAEKYLKVPL